MYYLVVTSRVTRLSQHSWFDDINDDFLAFLLLVADMGVINPYESLSSPEYGCEEGDWPLISSYGWVRMRDFNPRCVVVVVFVVLHRGR